MKITPIIYGDNPPENTLRLRLVHRYGAVWLAAVDAKGEVLEGGYLLGVNSDGTFYRVSNVSPQIPVKLSEGRIQTVVYTTSSGLSGE